MKNFKINASWTMALLAAIFFMGSASAQDTTSKHRDYVTRWVTIQGGYAFMQNDVINQFLANNAPALNNNMGTLGISGLMEYKRWIGGITVQGGMSQPVTIDNYAGHPGQDYQLANGFYNGLLHLGYAVVNTPMMKIYPILGLGGGRASAQLVRTNISQASIVANNQPQNSNVQIGKAMAYIDLGIGFDFFHRMKPMEGNPRRNGGGVVGLRVGYSQGIGLGSWGYNGDNNVNENPTYNPGMFYAKLTVGVFRTHRADMHWGQK
jgi:hypothetical protein